jgi:hypothetical protein
MPVCGLGPVTVMVSNRGCFNARLHCSDTTQDSAGHCRKGQRSAPVSAPVSAAAHQRHAESGPKAMRAWHEAVAPLPLRMGCYGQRALHVRPANQRHAEAVRWQVRHACLA